MSERLKQKKSVIERFLLPNPEWQEGYRNFNKSFGSPLGWLYLIEESGANRLLRLDRKGNCSFYANSKSNQDSCSGFLEKYFGQLAEKKTSWT